MSGLRDIDVAAGTTQASEVVLTPQQAALVEQAIHDLTEIAVLYERRLTFKNRYRQKAMLASMSRRAALAILRGGR